MKTFFHSTRGDQGQFTSKEAIRKGLADDGGLFVTDCLGQKTMNMNGLADNSYQKIAQEVLSLLLPDFSPQELDQSIAGAYGDQWSDPAITPLHRLGDDYLLELFAGPTCAFKDVALQMLPRLMSQSLADHQPSASQDQSKVMIVTATSGDTGKAAMAGFADVPATGITVFYPEGQVSQIQQLQMTTQKGANVSVCAVKGNFDDAQSSVKAVFSDRRLAQDLADRYQVTLSSANSINIGRLVPQVVYYFAAYGRLLRSGAISMGQEVEFHVPTGNFGDVLAGYYAKLIGLPVKRLVVASDRNNVLFDFLTTGIYDRRRLFYRTTSPSMDILVSSNLERMLYYLSGRDSRLVDTLMWGLQDKGHFQVSPALLADIRSLFGCGWASEEDVRQSIGNCWSQHHYLLDPHTACAYHAMVQQSRDPMVPRIVLGTASPFKFPRVVCQAIGLETSGSDFDCMERLSSTTGLKAPTSLRQLEQEPVLFTESIDVSQIGDFVSTAARAL